MLKRPALLSTLLLAAVLLLSGCGGADPESDPPPARTAVTPLPADLCPVVARSASPQPGLEKDRQATNNDGNPATASCVLLGVDPASSPRGTVAVSVLVRSYGDQASDLAADRVEEEVGRQCDELAEKHPGTELHEDDTCSHHATTEVVVGSFPTASTATAVVRLPEIHGVATVRMRVDGDDAGRSRAEVLAIGQRLATADLKD